MARLQYRVEVRAVVYDNPEQKTGPYRTPKLGTIVCRDRKHAEAIAEANRAVDNAEIRLIVRVYIGHKWIDCEEYEYNHLADDLIRAANMIEKDKMSYR